MKPSIAKKADATDVAAGDGGISSAFPSSVANANAQLATAADTPDGNDTLAGNARAMSARANDILQAAADKPADAQPATQPATETQVTSPDQLNDVDRTLPANATPATASVDAPAAPVTASSGESSWDQASLIGKIFIGLGALLTMASAARMFMM